MNYFELFEIPVSLKIDKALLPKKYFALQKKYHPDFFTNATEAEKEEALQKSSAINKAFKIFQQPDETIKYVLQLKGLLEEEEKYQLPTDFLMEVMELNETLEDNSAQQVAAFEKNIYTGVKDIIENYKDGVTPENDLLKIKDYYFRKKYLQRILERMGD